MKRIGPELKMPKFKGGETKVPPFLSDLYYDIRDRRLLPVILLILVAIVAAPILLKDEPETVPPAPSPATKVPGSEQAAEKTLTVVKSAPGLRDYKVRLRRRQASNPFKQHFTGPVLKGSELNEQTTTTTTTEVQTESTGGSTPGSSNGGGSPSVVPGQLTYFSFAVDVRISKARTKPDGTVEKSEPEDREKVVPPKPLPSEATPVVTYMGIGGKNHLPLFLVSEDVTSVFGEGDCISGTGHCQLIELEPQQPEIFEYGENKVRYKITVLKLVPVVTGHS